FRAMEVVLHSEDGNETVKRVIFAGDMPRRVRVPVQASDVDQVELRIAAVDGPGPVGLTGVGIAEIGVMSSHGPLDLREFIRTPTDLAARASGDRRPRGH